MARTPRKQVTWKVDRKAEAPTRPRQYFPDTPLRDEDKERYEKCLVPGGMFVLKLALRIMPQAGFEPPPHPYAIESWYVTDTVAGNKGAVALYAGTVRVEEQSGKGLIRVPRHSFIINGGRYLITNLALLEPVAG